MSYHNHAGVDPRAGFLAPRAFVYRCTESASATPPPPIPGLVRPSGAALDGRARMTLTFDDTSLHLRAEIAEQRVVAKPDLSPDSPRFWT